MQQQAQALSKAVAVFKVGHTVRPVQATVAEDVEPAQVKATVAERRGPNRATNVARLPKREAEVKPQAPAESTKTGTNDDWSEF
jgi:hypothetical protein